MARNEEKAMHMLNRWYTQKQEIGKKDIQRPKGYQRIQQINSLGTCQKWRNTIIKEISKLVTQIQNAGLGEFKIREINDEINDLFKQKKQYEERIYELGGGNLQEAAFDGMEGSELPGFSGYKYFGAAKDLPGVRELFQKEKPKPQKRQMLVDVYKKIDFDNYLAKVVNNLQDIEENEKRIEEEEREELYQEWVLKNADLIKQKLPANKQNDKQAIMELIDQDGDDEEQDMVNQMVNEDKNTKEVEDQSQNYILEEKKRQLMEQYLKDIQK